MTPSNPSRRPVSPFTWIGIIVAILATLLAVSSGFGTRFGWWPFPTGLRLLWIAGYAGLAAAILSLIGAIKSRPSTGRAGLMRSIAGFTIGCAIAGILGIWVLTAKRVPMIHDISTDLENPPPFVAILARRKDAPNPSAYGGPEVKAKQRAGYPNLGPLTLTVPPDEAFRRALDAARRMGWELVSYNEPEGRIEATDTTFWFGFKDDVVVRVTAFPGGSRIDVRSVSRVGRSDVGTNARRIASYLKHIDRRS